MVATRRGTRVGSPVKNTSDENSETMQPTPSTRRTRRKTLIKENQPQSELACDSQQDEQKDDSTASSSVTSPPKRDTRRSTRHLADKMQSSSTHEADVSESESCCSVVSDVQVKSRTRRRTAVREKPAVQDETSEAETCLSEVSTTHSRRAPRSLRKRVLTSEAATKHDDPSGAKSCNFAIDTRQTTRSHRKPAVPSTEPDSSEPESCSFSVSGHHSSVVRRSARNQKVKPTELIPLSFEETTDTPSSPVSKKRGPRPKTEVDDKNDSDGCESGPSMSPWRSTRRQPKPDALVGESDSESVASDVCASQGSPSLKRGRGRGRGTPCRQTGSASSTYTVSVTRTRSKVKVTSDVDDTVTTAAAMPEEQGEELELHLKSDENDGDKAEDKVEQLDSTMTMDTSEAQECVMIEERAEDTTVVFDQDELIEMQEPQSSMQDVESVEDSGKPVAEEPGDVTMEVMETRKEGMVEAAAVDPEPAVVEEAIEEQICSEPVKEDTVEAVAEDLEPAVVEERITENQTCTEPVNQDVVDATLENSVPTVVEECENQVESQKKGVIVYEEAKISENDTVTLDDLEGPSTSSHAQANLTTTEDTSKKPPSQRKIISLLDSSEDEDSADESLYAEEEGCSQKAEDELRSEDHVMCSDENQLSEEAQSGLFAIDTRAGCWSKKEYYYDGKRNEVVDEEDFVDEENDDDEDSKVLFAPKKLPPIQLSSTIDTGLKMNELGGLYISFDASKPKSLAKYSKTKHDLNNPDELLKKSVIVPDFEKKDAVPPYNESKHALKLKRKAEREMTTGDGWFNMRAPELTEELKNDLKALKMRSAMDPKRFYKKNDREGFPKYFQVGTVVDSPEDFYSSRLPKKERKRTIVEELLADAEFRNYNKKKYQEIMAEKAAQSAGKIKQKQHMKQKQNTSQKKKINK
ncbi:hypothetical protein QQF64_032453 [Cirrhinus molitorella]|uniref:Uncharacterized protein n=2 Tax=Cirrhinus molitorella TaxID=172907 RepID=A0AA88PW60_9TELE|nr:hypothetical protein Q8A67_009779 [Cirrhinus molitorella]